MGERVEVVTVGHSTRSADAMMDILVAAGVILLVDVRSRPRSRRNPQFNSDVLPAALRPSGIAYRHVRELGGLRTPRPDSPHTALREDGFRGYADHMQTAVFVQALESLIRCAAAARTAVMCAEADPASCHRSMIADALVARGVRVVHLLGHSVTREHVLTPHARLTRDRVAYPGPPTLWNRSG